jgi:hypothetical protein
VYTREIEDRTKKQHTTQTHPYPPSGATSISDTFIDGALDGIRNSGNGFFSQHLAP